MVMSSLPNEDGQMELKGLTTGAIFKRCTAPIAIRVAARASQKTWIQVETRNRGVD